VVGGLGETNQSIITDVSSPKAGHTLDTHLFKIEPRNIYGFLYMHRDYKDYFFIKLYSKDPVR